MTVDRWYDVPLKTTFSGILATRKSFSPDILRLISIVIASRTFVTYVRTFHDVPRQCSHSWPGTLLAIIGIEKSVLPCTMGIFNTYGLESAFCWRPHCAQSRSSLTCIRALAQSSILNFFIISVNTAPGVKYTEELSFG